MSAGRSVADASALAPIRVFGLGNVLMEDDGAGPHVLHHLQSGWEFPAEVSLADLGTPGLDLTAWVLDARAVILVDTVRSDLPPGGIRLYRRDEILRVPPQPRLSPHDPGVKEALLAADFAGRGPSEVLLVGIVPEGCGMGTRLSGAVRGAVARAAAEVLAELERLGLPATPRPRPLTDPPWWE